MNANNEQHITQTLEDSINQGLLEMQEMAGSAKEEVGKYNFANSVAQEALYYLGSNSPITSALQPLTHTIHIITSKLEKQLEIAEITLEYINTDDSITIVGKVAGNTINTWILTEGMYLSKVIAQEIVQVVTKGKTPIGIAIFSAGSIISFFFAGKAEEIFKDLYFNQGRDTFKPLENFLQRHFNFPAKPSCPKGSTMPNGSCAPSPQEFWYPLFSFLFLSPYPKPSQAHQEALAKTKELKSKITLASSPHIQSDVSSGYIDERDLQEYKEQQYVLQKEQRLYTQALQNYTQELAYKSSILNFCLERLGNSILPHITENKDLTYNEALNLVSKNNYMIKILDESDIDSIDVNSPFAYLRALFLCENIIVVDEQGNPTLNESNLFKHLGYKDDAAIIFALDKQTLTKDYLNTRKSLYKTIMNLREQREQDYKEEQERISQLSYEEYQREREKTLREQQRQERIQRARNPNTTNHLILETKDKNNAIIFLDSDISLSNLIHIHNNKIDIFTKDGTILDIQRLETLLQEYININHNTDNNANNNDNNTAITLDLLNSPNTQIFLYSQLLLGGSESPISSQEYFFGLLDSKNSDTLLDTLKPIYYFAPKDESSGLGKLSIFYHSSTLTLLNYSIIDSSLNIKLECTSKESQKLLSNALSLKEKEYQSKTIQAQQSIATLHSLLENQEVKCIHGGKVILKSNKGKTFKSDGIPLILESDLLGSKISGCPRSVGGVSDPCTQVVNVKASLSQKKINGEYAILQELIGGCLSDKGFPLEVSFVPSKIKFDHSYDPKIGLTKQSLTTSQSFNLPILRLYYKEHNYQIDNTLIQRYTLNNTLYELKEESNPQFFKEVIFEEKDLMDLSKSIENTKDIAPYQDKIILFDSLKQEFQKYYEFKEVTLNLGIHTFFLIFVIPKRIPKIYQKDYKALDSQRKDYGIGYFKELLEYNKDYKETNTQNNPYTPFLLYHTRVFLAPAKAKKIHFEFALGLDNYIESKDKESNTNVCKFKVLSGDVIEEREEVEGGEKEKGIISLHFNGKLLTIIVNKDDKEIERISFQAVSGSPQEKSNGKHYFTYEKERQMLKSEGPIPEGEYYITPLSENIDDGVQVLEVIGDLKGSLSGFLSKIGIPKFGTFYGGSYAWGVIRIPIQPKTKTLTDSQGHTVTRGDFFIHGGAEAGSAGCIDLWKNNNEFFRILLEYVEQYKDKILKNQGKIPLIVEYESSTKVECDSEWQLQMQQGQTLPFKTPFLFTTNQCRILQ